MFVPSLSWIVFICKVNRSKKAFFSQAPPCDDTRGWIEYEDVPVGAAYTLDHTVLMASDYFFSRPLIGRLRALQPVRRNTTATCFAPFSHCRRKRTTVARQDRLGTDDTKEKRNKAFYGGART